MEGKTMTYTLTAIRKACDHSCWFSYREGLEDLIPYTKSKLRVVEELYHEGYCDQFSMDMLSDANSYKVNSGDPDFHISQTYDLHGISATKAAAKRFGYYLFGITA